MLVLDEPTNHLDLEAIHALVEALKAYAGTVVFVSHDRWFVSELATRVVEITPEGPRDFPGTYAEYLAKLGDDHLDGDAVALRARAERADKKRREPTDAAANGAAGAPARAGRSRRSAATAPRSSPSCATRCWPRSPPPRPARRRFKPSTPIRASSSAPAATRSTRW